MSSAYWFRKARPSWHAKRTIPDPVTTAPPPPLGDLIRTLKLDDLGDEFNEFTHLAEITDARTVTSFSWTDKKGSAPTILVPGKPPLWTPQAIPSRLNEDNGSYFRDKNAARYPKHPTEPAVIASLAADPTLPADLDLFACGSTLGNLLRFVRGQDRTFRMLAYKVHNTLFLVRHENSPTELIPDVRGFGHTFPEANTTWEADVKGSASHQRLLRYNFGGLDILVRFEADGYIQPSSTPTASTTSPSPSNPATTTTLDSLTSSLSTTTISPSLPTSSNPTPATPTLTITPAGTLTPHSTLFDLKTRSIHTRLRKNHLADELPRLWVTQLPTFILAYHTSGLFQKQDTEIRDVRDDVRAWEEEHAEELAKLAGLLHWLRREVVSSEVGVVGPGRGVEVCCAQVGELEVREMLEDAGEVLSSVVRERWEGVGKGFEGGVEEGEEKEREVDVDSEEDWERDGGGLAWDGDGDDNDFTACSADSCGYCGRCSY